MEAPLIVPLFIALVDLVTDSEVIDAAGTALVDAAGREVISGGADLLLGTSGEGETVLEPIFDSGSSLADPANIAGPGDIGQITKGQLRALWDSAITFARWTGREIMKGALFQAGMDALGVILAKNPPPDIENADLRQIVGALSASMKILTEVTTEWRRWCVRQFPHRDEYGILNVEDTLIPRFEIVRNKLAALDVFLVRTLGPLLAQASKSIDGANIGGLKAATKTYAGRVMDLSEQIRDKEGLMVHAGLKDHKDDVQKCINLLE